MAAAIALSIILALVTTVVIGIVVRNTIARSYQAGFQEAKSLYNQGQAQVWDNAVSDTLQWVNDGLHFDQKPNNPFRLDA